MQDSKYHVASIDKGSDGHTKFNAYHRLTLAEAEEYHNAVKTLNYWLQSDLETFTMLENTYKRFCDTVSNKAERSRGINIAHGREELLDINTDFLSFLSARSLYLEHTAKKIGSANQDILDKHKLATNIEFDSHFSYRLFGQLRNYALHRGMPITGLNASGSLNPLTDEQSYTYDVSFLPNDLIKDKKMKTSVKDELKLHTAPIDVILMTEEAIRSLRVIRVKTVKAFLPLIKREIEIVRYIISLTPKDNGLIILSGLDDIGSDTVTFSPHITYVPHNLLEYADKISALKPNYY